MNKHVRRRPKGRRTKTGEQTRVKADRMKVSQSCYDVVTANELSGVWEGEPEFKYCRSWMR